MPTYEELGWPRAWAALDVETTRDGRVIEIGVAHLENGSVTPAFNTLVNPGNETRITGQSIHQIRADELADAPRFQHICGFLLQKIEGRIIVSHNAIFDLKVLNDEFRRLETDFSPLRVRAEPENPHSHELWRPHICTMRARTSLGLVPNQETLQKAARRVGVYSEKYHVAIDDAMVTAKVWWLTMESCRLQRHGWSAVRDAAAPFARTLRSDCIDLEEYQGAPWYPKGEDPSLPRTGLEDVGEQQPSNLLKSIYEECWSDFPAGITAYCNRLQQALDDKVVDRREFRRLASIVDEFNLTPVQIERVHREFFYEWRKNPFPQEEVEKVASLLGIPELVAPEEPNVEPDLSNHFNMGNF